MRILLLILIVVPATEIGLFIYFGKIIGVLPTVSLIILTAIAGTYLAKLQGLVTIRKVQAQLYAGHVPSGALLDGICILIGGVLLVTPGFLTDIIGLLLLVPQTRTIFKRLLERIFTNWIDKRTITIIR